MNLLEQWHYSSFPHILLLWHIPSFPQLQHYNWRDENHSGLTTKLIVRVSVRSKNVTKVRYFLVPNMKRSSIVRIGLFYKVYSLRIFLLLKPNQCLVSQTTMALSPSNFQAKAVLRYIQCSLFAGHNYKTFIAVYFYVNTYPS